MIRRQWIDLEDRYIVTTDDGKHILIVTQCYTTACEYDRFARRRIGPETLTKFQRYLRIHRRYWREGLDDMLADMGLEPLYTKRTGND